MTDDQFTRLFKHMTDGFAAIDQRFDAVDKRISGIYDLLDKNIAEHQKQEEERAAMNRQLDRHDKWLHDLAEKTGAQLHYE